MTDDELLSGIATFVASERKMLGCFLRHLAAIDQRRLYAEVACSSLFAFCRQRLGLSDSEAYYRTTAARIGQRWPQVFELVETGRIHLSALVLLHPHLTADNHAELLAAAAAAASKTSKSSCPPASRDPTSPRDSASCPTGARRA